MKPANIFCWVAMICIAGCREVEFSEMPMAHELKSLVGKAYCTKSELVAYGIRAHSAAAATHVTVIPKPGIAGTQVAFSIQIAQGTKILISRVLNSTRISNTNTTLEVDIEGLKIPGELPVYIEMIRGNKDPGASRLNPQHYVDITQSLANKDEPASCESHKEGLQNPARSAR